MPENVVEVRLPTEAELEAVTALVVAQLRGAPRADPGREDRERGPGIVSPSRDQEGQLMAWVEAEFFGRTPISSMTTVVSLTPPRDLPCLSHPTFDQPRAYFSTAVSSRRCPPRYCSQDERNRGRESGGFRTHPQRLLTLTGTRQNAPGATRGYGPADPAHRGR